MFGLDDYMINIYRVFFTLDSITFGQEPQDLFIK